MILLITNSSKPLAAEVIPNIFEEESLLLPLNAKTQAAWSARAVKNRRGKNMPKIQAELN